MTIYYSYHRHYLPLHSFLDNFLQNMKMKSKCACKLRLIFCTKMNYTRLVDFRVKKSFGFQNNQSNERFEIIRFFIFHRRIEKVGIWKITLMVKTLVKLNLYIDSYTDRHVTPSLSLSLYLCINLSHKSKVKQPKSKAVEFNQARTHFLFSNFDCGGGGGGSGSDGVGSEWR